ncbi:MAG TPA: hypothetical protein VK059_09960 [Nocardioidaceae bacterium]|nr:hypothetical protein [Nocardioidaceae bacterium]
MPDEDDPQRRRRHKRAADAFGELLPESARDESARAWGDRDDGSRDDELLRDVPPHHG